MFEELFVDSVLVAFVGALLSLDRSAVIQSMLSRPLVSASVTGFLLGDLSMGLAAGFILEFLYMGDLPVGSYMPTHETGLSVVVSAVSVAFAKSFPAEIFYSTASLFSVVLPVVLVSIPVAFLFKHADIFSRRINERLFLNASRTLEEGIHPAVVKENLKGIFNFFWPVAVMLFVTVFILSLIAKIFAQSINIGNTAFLGPIVVAGLILAIAMALRAVKMRGSLVVFSVSGVAAAVLWTFVR